MTHARDPVEDTRRLLRPGSGGRREILRDLTLLGLPIMGHVTAKRSGHGQHLAFLQALVKQPQCWTIVELKPKGEEKILSSRREAVNPLFDFPFAKGAKIMADACLATA